MKIRTERKQNIVKYINAADVLPEELVEEISKYVNGELLYIPSQKEKQHWGEMSGSRKFYEDRNKEIKKLYGGGVPIKKLACDFGLSYETIRKIVKSDRDHLA